MFEGTDEDLRQNQSYATWYFLHSVILAKTMGDKFAPDMVAGHCPVGRVFCSCGCWCIEF